MTTFNKQDIVLVPFPFSELSFSKKRPALVLAYIASRDELICLMLTSTTKVDAFVDIPINNLEGTGLPKPTVARTSRLFTLKGYMVVKRIGKLNYNDYEKITNKIVQTIKR